MSQNLPGPKQETINMMEQNKVHIFAHPPAWVQLLCAIPQKKRHIIDPLSLRMQLGGILLIILSTIAGFFITPVSFVLGIFVSMFLYFTIPTILIKNWS
jgi:hypothetical protein